MYSLKRHSFTRLILNIVISALIVGVMEARSKAITRFSSLDHFSLSTEGSVTTWIVSHFKGVSDWNLWYW